VKIPRCSFCYQEHLGNISFSPWKIYDTIRNILESHPEVETLCYEYSGYNLGFVLEWWGQFSKTKTMTTMPSLVTPVLVGALKRHGFQAIALSYDQEKCSVEQWIEKAKVIRESGMKVACNALIQSLKDFPLVTLSMMKVSDQLNLLVRKPTGKISNPTAWKVTIEGLKRFVPVTVDNCLGVQLGLIDSCKAGEDFIHVLPDGSTVPCSFTDWCYLSKKTATQSNQCVTEKEFIESLTQFMKVFRGTKNLVWS
jgi:hypothetical protein